MVKETAEPRKYSNAVRRRLKFIDFRLCWVGDIGRADLHEQFGISLQQATNDFGTYQEIAAENLRYSPQRRCYISEPGFEAVFPTTTVRAFLRRLFRSANSSSGSNRGWLGEGLDVKITTPPTRDPSKDIVRPLLRAVRQRQAIDIDYVSMSSGQSKGRRIVPHAFGFDGFRWHVRAFCFKRNRYLDFVLTRISKIGNLSELKEVLDADHEWTTEFSFDVVPDNSLSSEKRYAIAHDFQMQFPNIAAENLEDLAKNACLTVHTNYAMLYYTLRLYGFDPRALENEQIAHRSMFGLELKNPTKVETGLKRDI